MSAPRTFRATDLPRLELHQMTPGLASYLEPRVRRLGYLGEFFKCTGHQPDALLAFMQFTEAAKGGLQERFVELIALTVAGWMRNDYERNQHERLSIRLGFGRAWIEAVNSLKPDSAAGLDDTERDLQRVVLGILQAKGIGMTDDFGRLVARLGAAQAVAVLMIAGRYVVHALIVNTLSLAPPVPSIFEDGFTA